jgi:hypothetical protein
MRFWRYCQRRLYGSLSSLKLKAQSLKLLFSFYFEHPASRIEPQALALDLWPSPYTHGNA